MIRWKADMTQKMFHVEHLIIISGIFLLGILLFSFNLRFFFIQPSTERLFYMQSIGHLYQGYFFGGLGIGQYVFMMQQFFDEKLLLWQFQPIHNVFLLIFSEVGIVGFGLFLWFFVYSVLRNNKYVPRGTSRSKPEKCSTWNICEKSDTMFHVEHLPHFVLKEKNLETDEEVAGFEIVPRGTILRCLCRSLLVVVGIIMLFDHYFWDIQQGQLLLWIIFALAVSSKRY